MYVARENLCQEKAETLADKKKKLVALPICPPQIPYGLALVSQLDFRDDGPESNPPEPRSTGLVRLLTRCGTSEYGLLLVLLPGAFYLRIVLSCSDVIFGSGVTHNCRYFRTVVYKPLNNDQ